MTEKKTTSNRINAMKSTGPKTPTGKAVVSQNARSHGILSRHLIVEGESQAEFSELLRLLAEEFQPVGIVEHALADRVGIAIWRQRRFVRAESAEVSLNQQRFNSWHKNQVGNVLNLGSEVVNNIQAPEDLEETDIALLKEQRNLWKSLSDKPFADLPAGVQTTLLERYKVDANQIDAAVKKEHGTWAALFASYVAHYEGLIEQQRILEVSRLLMQSRALPAKTDLLSRYQTALDNDFYKALKALRETQSFRQAKSLISAMPVNASDEE